MMGPLVDERLEMVAGPPHSVHRSPTRIYESDLPPIRDAVFAGFYVPTSGAYQSTVVVTGRYQRFTGTSNPVNDSSSGMRVRKIRGQIVGVALSLLGTESFIGFGGTTSDAWVGPMIGVIYPHKLTAVEVDRVTDYLMSMINGVAPPQVLSDNSGLWVLVC